MPIGPYTELSPSQLLSTPWVPNHWMKEIAPTSEGPSRADSPTIRHTPRSGRQARWMA